MIIHEIYREIDICTREVGRPPSYMLIGTKEYRELKELEQFQLMAHFNEKGPSRVCGVPFFVINKESHLEGVYTK